MPVMTNNQSPYPRLGECYRLLVKALDTKASNRHLDRLAREGDFDWELLANLRVDLIETPLRKKTNDDFAAFVMASVDTLHTGYIELVKKVPLDSLTRTESLPALITHFYAPYAASFVLQMNKAIASPPIASLLDDSNQPIDVVFAWLENELSIPKDHLGLALYEDSTGENKNGRDAIYRWRKKHQLPSLNSICLVKSRLIKAFPLRSKLINAFSEWLIVARALTFFNQQSAPGLSLRKIMLREVLAGIPQENIGQVLSLINIQASANKRELVEHGLILQHDLRRTSTKLEGDKKRTREALNDFRQQLALKDPQGVSTYYLEWLEGRWHVLLYWLSAKVFTRNAIPVFVKGCHTALLQVKPRLSAVCHLYTQDFLARFR